MDLTRSARGRAHDYEIAIGEDAETCSVPIVSKISRSSSKGSGYRLLRLLRIKQPLNLDLESEIAFLKSGCGAAKA